MAYQVVGQEWSFTGPKAYRSKSIAPEVWERHRPEIEELYERKSLEEVMLHMKTRGFSPSKRQYIYQFEKWGFQKYNKNANGCADKQAADVSTSFLEVVPELPEHDEGSPSLGPSAPSATKRKWTEAEQHEKRAKLSSSTDACEGNQIALPDVLPKLSSENCVSETSSSLSKEETLTVTSIKVEEHKRDGPILPGECQPPDQPQTSDSARPESKHPFLRFDSTDLTDDLPRLSVVQMDGIIAAADFLAASQFPVEAFLLFFIILARHRSKSDVSQWMLESALIGCTRNAVHEWQILATESILKVHMHNEESLNGLRPVVYDRLIEEVLTKKDRKNLTIQPSRLAAKTVWPEYSLFEATDDVKPLVLEMAYQSNKSGQQVCSGVGVDKIASQEPRWVHLVDILEIVNIIRQSLRWCHHTLERKPIIHSTSGRYLSGPSRVYYLALYHNLFQAYLEDSKDILTSRGSRWAELSKIGMGLSPARFLANVALMLSKHAGPKFYNCVTECSSQSQNEAWTELAMSTCKRLLASSDKLLVCDFLSQHYLVSSGSLRSSGVELERYESVFRPWMRDQVRELLGIYLPREHQIQLWLRTRSEVDSPMYLSMKRDDRGDFASEKRKESVSNEAIPLNQNPTLSEPLSAAEYRGLETLRDQYQGTLGDDTVHKEVATSGSVRSQSRWSRLTSDSWSLARYLPGRESPAGSQRSWSRPTSDSWSLSRYIPGRRSQVSGNVVDSMITDCSRISISTNEPEVDGVREKVVTMRQPQAAGWI